MMRMCTILALATMTAVADEYDHTPFNPDPEHIWNRIHGFFFVREADDGTRYTAEELDPPLALNTLYPLTAPGHETIVAMLDEFLETNAASQISDPLKRAIFQRDLWAVFDWTTQSHYGWFVEEGRGHTEARRELQLRLAKIIRQVALTREGIELLPDNYGVASSSGRFSTEYNPVAPDTAFLPSGLTTGTERWQLLRADSRPGLIAPEHIEASMGRSVFLVFSQFPSEPGYLKRLQAFDAPWEIAERPISYQREGSSILRVNPDLPQFPAESQFILLRRTLLVDASGALVLSPLTESVQIRVYPTEPTNEFMKDNHSQDDYAFELDRNALFNGEHGGLRLVTSEDRILTSAPFGFVTREVDPLESNNPSARQQFKAIPRMGCKNCHSGSGIRSVRIYSGPRTLLQMHPPRLIPTLDRTLEAQRTVLWKEQQYSWGLLQGLWNTQ